MNAPNKRDAGHYQTEIGSRLRLLREALGYTRAEFAELMGTTEPNLKEIEFGRQFPSPSYLRRLTATSMVDWNWIYSGLGHLSQDARERIETYRRKSRKSPSRQQSCRSRTTKADR